MDWVRKLGAVVKMGVVWAIAWIPLTLVATVVDLFLRGELPFGPYGWLMVRTVAGSGAIAGGISGTIFALLVAGFERRKTFATLSTRRLVGAGILAALTPAAVLGLILLRDSAAIEIAPAVVRILVFTGLLGAASAGGILYVARRAPELPGERAAAQIRDIT